MLWKSTGTATLRTASFATILKSVISLEQSCLVQPRHRRTAMAYEGEILNQCGLIQLDFSATCIVAVSGDGPNV
jgi:hypothetical protein